MTIRCHLNPPHLNRWAQRAQHADQIQCDAWVAGGFGAGSVIRGKVPKTPKPHSSGSPTPPESSTSPSASSSATPAPAPTSPSTSEARAGAPASPSPERPPLVRRILRPMQRPPAPAGTATPPPAGIVDAALSEWQLSDEYASKMWMGIGRFFVWLVMNLMDLFEAEEPLTKRAVRRVELSDEDCKTLGLFTKEGLTTLLKKLGVKSAERAEQLIDGFGAFLILGALLVGFVKVLWLDIVETPRYKRWAADREKGAPAPGTPRAPGRFRFPTFGGRSATPSWDNPTPPPGPEPGAVPG